jgi:pyruvate/2-oxoglutarate dehydrogenase complex dihydrolipoamide acyltransferase (E2) component
MEGFAAQIVSEAQREKCMELAKAWRELGEAARAAALRPEKADHHP